MPKGPVPPKNLNKCTSDAPALYHPRARKLAVVSEAHALELGRFSTRNNFYRQVLRRNEVLVLTYFDRKIFPGEHCSTSAK
jgi:hypothetical protein